MANPIFKFEIDENTLTLECDSFGKETVYLNSVVVKTDRRFKIKGKYEYTFGSETYFLKFKIKNPFTGHLICNLYNQDKLIESQETKAALTDQNKYLSIILLIVSCGSVGYFGSHMGAWSWASPILFILAVVASMSVRERIYEISIKKE